MKGGKGKVSEWKKDKRVRSQGKRNNLLSLWTFLRLAKLQKVSRTRKEALCKIFANRDRPLGLS